MPSEWAEYAIEMVHTYKQTSEKGLAGAWLSRGELERERGWEETQQMINDDRFETAIGPHGEVSGFEII